MVDLTNITNYEVMQNDKYGRYLVSKTDLDSGELIFMDTPFAVGPKPDTPPLCLGCYCPVTENQTCSRCGWPCCGTTCEMSPHHTAECDVFVNARIKFQSPEDWTISLPQLDCITPLRVHIRAAVPIKAGEPLYLCYTHTLSPTLERREHLLQSKFFNCDCFRCSDPTEGNTHMSTLKCSKCDNGVLLSINPLDDEAVWKCNDKKCCYTTTNKAVKKLLNDVQMEIDQLDILEPRYEAIQQREAILKKYESVFHPGHALLLSIKHALVQLYGKVDGYRIKELSDVLLEKKSDFCRELLKTLGVVAPGESRMRGMMLYEMHIPLMLMARNDYTAGLINREKLIERLQETLQCLADSARILMREDPSSHEGIIGHIAAKSFEQLKCSLDNL